MTRTPRTVSQNSKLWPLLREVSEQLEHCGRKYSPEEWLAIFMHACGHQMKFLPALDGNSFVAYRASSRTLSVEQMSELIECILAEGTQRGVKFREQQGITWNADVRAA